jgi:7-carboxy-7-deazaguanine synthase
MSATVAIIETFASLQGESTYAGLPCYFVRLGGCNLACRYCDTTYARGPGRDTPIEALVRECAASGVGLAEITGGEPLLQAGFRDLAVGLGAGGCRVLVETNGSRDISAIPDGVVAVMDLKCPGSGETAAMDLHNLQRLRPYDEVKFVISDRVDFDWAADMVRTHTIDRRCHAVLFSPVAGELPLATLGGWILETRLPVRLQAALHKLAGMR